MEKIKSESRCKSFDGLLIKLFSLIITCTRCKLCLMRFLTNASPAKHAVDALERFLIIFWVIQKFFFSLPFAFANFAASFFSIIFKVLLAKNYLLTQSYAIESCLNFEKCSLAIFLIKFSHIERQLSLVIKIFKIKASGII